MTHGEWESSTKAQRSIAAKKEFASPRDATSRAALGMPDFDLGLQRGRAEGHHAGYIEGWKAGYNYARTDAQKAKTVDTRGEANTPAQSLASKLNSENLKPRPEPDPNPWPKIASRIRKWMGLAA